LGESGQIPCTSWFRTQFFLRFSPDLFSRPPPGVDGSAHMSDFRSRARFASYLASAPAAPRLSVSEMTVYGSDPHAPCTMVFLLIASS